MSRKPIFQDLSKFNVPPGFRGRNVAVVQLWWLCQATLFALSPQPFYGWRAALLRLFGAKIGKQVKVRSSSRFTYPWKVSIGDHSWIGDRAELYSLDAIEVGAHCCISQDCYIATSGHNTGALAFDYTNGKVIIEDEVWLASGVFVMPNLRICHGAVVGARSLVSKDVPGASIMMGSPARKIGIRTPNETKYNAQ